MGKEIMGPLPFDPATRPQPQVQGVCPGCGNLTLILAREGFVTCAWQECPNPNSADEVLHRGRVVPDLVEDADGAPYPEEVQQKIAEIRGWWEAVSSADFEKMAPKIGEYTSADLEIMGVIMENWGLAAPEGGGGMEASTMWYILGKVARAVAAYKEARQPSEDTLHDITVYAMMTRRIRETGDWP